MEIGEKIRKMREVKEFSQEEMAHKLNMSLNGYAKIERGESRVYLHKLEQIAKVLGVDLLELLSLNEKSIFCFINDNKLEMDNLKHACNAYINSDEAEKFHLILQHKDEMLVEKDLLIAEKERLIKQQEQQIQMLNEMLAFLKK
ncbi:XRE family transcriptional regulator [Conchiformibius steedae]|uniref:XRE family transcriptional regulator n=2 Tax=Conchiformibius steedae TaxID=153493 RepID=A0A3P2A847_9NEIS|nr:XRE family transcriptional regulator [Conchiformibius steedae]